MKGRFIKGKKDKKALIYLLCLFVVLILLYSIWASPLTQPNEHFITIYIRHDGTIDPDNAPIIKSGNRYLLIKNFFGAIKIECNNITLDGGGHVLRGTLNGTIGVDIDGKENVTISNITLQSFNFGIVISTSMRITVLNVRFVGNYFGMLLSESSECAVRACNITGGTYCGIWMVLSNNNTFYENVIQRVTYGVKLELSNGNHFWRNTFVQNVMPMLADDQSVDNRWDENSILEPVE
ncbi:MAG: NosD domain-containing protein [Candidatus Bathyarchaeia archaeon]